MSLIPYMDDKGREMLFCTECGWMIGSEQESIHYSDQYKHINRKDDSEWTKRWTEYWEERIDQGRYTLLGPGKRGGFIVTGLF